MEQDQLLSLAEIYRFSADAIKHLLTVYKNRTENVLQALKTPGKRYYIRVNTLKIDPNSFVKKLRDKGLRADYHPLIPEAVFLPVEGPLSLPEVSQKIVADKYAAESVLQGANLYAPGVTNCRGIKRGDLVLITDEYGQPVGAGITRMNETEILQYRKGLAVELTHPRYRIPCLRETEEFKNGLIYPQSFPAILASRVLDPQPGETVVDMCAAPGGKTGHIAQLMHDKGLVIAIDRNQEKITELSGTVTRLGFKNVKLICQDARYLDINLPNLKADRVIIDPPCSAMGVRPKLFDHTTDAEIRSLSEYQRQFIRVAAKIVKPNGVVVYSTCTLTVNENEENLRYAVEECGLEPEDIPFKYGSKGLEWVFSGARCALRFDPDVHDSPGYFIARFRKIS
ncbi:RsmB/NOP family class I SAM-dependent RNA methyltransferase [Candidatus Bathyarchaeota archaeon]|nr:RsmB/NOP family class I SAM-dependent RNA methyltransferase [Candidatus Bathyarchaeota archaeon]